MSGPLDQFRLDGRVVALPGGTGGIGMALAKESTGAGGVAVIGRTAGHALGGGLTACQ